MEMFNLIETFFFISLGISFILILLLVYHFKQRLNGSEQKCDTMFEIINNVVQELTHVKNIQMGMQYRMQSQQHQNPILHSLHPSVLINKEISRPVNDKILVSDGEDDDQLDSESGSESDCVDTDDDEEEEEVDSDDDGAVRLINIDSTVDIAGQLQVESLSVEKISMTDEGIESTLEQIDITNEPTLQETVQESYRKMTLSALKAYVIDRGYCTEPSKLKKHELIKIIEDSQK